MRCCQCHHDIDGEQVVRKVKAVIEREDLVECLIHNSLMRCFSFDLAAAARIVATVVSVVAL